MDFITLQGEKKPIPALSYGTLRKNKDLVDAFTADDLTLPQRVEAAIPFLRLAFPDATEEDFDALTPGAIQLAGAQLYRATFARPEADAPAQPNP